MRRASPSPASSNYKEVFTTAAYRSAVFTSIQMTVTVVVVSVLLGLGIALLLDRKFFGRGAVRTMMIAPFLIVPIAAAVFWGNGMLETGFGLVDGVLGELGVKNAQNISFLTTHPKLSIEIELIWQWTPFMMLILLAGLQSRDSGDHGGGHRRRRERLADVPGHHACRTCAATSN